MIRNYMFIGFLVLTMGIGGVFIWQSFKIDTLEHVVQQKDTEIAVAQETGKVESFETRWEAIAQENNHTKDEHVKKEPALDHDSNTTTIYFFGLFSKD